MTDKDKKDEVNAGVKSKKPAVFHVDKKTIDQYLDDFYQSFASIDPYKVPLEKTKNAKAKKELERFLGIVLAGSDPQQPSISNPDDVFTYGSFYLEEPEQIDGRKANLMKLWQEYLAQLPADKKDSDFVKAAQELSNKFDPKRHRSKLEASQGQVVKAVTKKSPAVTPPATPPLPIISDDKAASPIYRASIGQSSVNAFMATAAVPIATMLLSGTSRIAICAVIAMAAPAWVMPAIGAGIGLAVGTATSAIRNRKAIGADMDKVDGGWNKTKALMVGIGRSASVTQVVFNVASGVIGMGALSVLAGYICDGAAQATDTLTQEIVALKEQVGGLKETIQAQQEIISGQGETITGLTNTMNDMSNKVDALTGQVGELSAKVGDISEHVSSLDEHVQGLDDRITELEIKAEAPEEIPTPEPEPEIIPEKEPEGIPKPEPEPEIPAEEPVEMPEPEKEPEVPAEEPIEKPGEGKINLFSVSPSFETVSSGDSLWDIAARQMGVSPSDAAQTTPLQDYIEGIIGANQDNMPELANNPNVINIGDHLNMPTADTVPAECDWAKVDAGQSGACRFPALKAA